MTLSVLLRLLAFLRGRFAAYAVATEHRVARQRGYAEALRDMAADNDVLSRRARHIANSINNITP